MMDAGTAHTSVGDVELAQLIGELTNRLQAGESIDLESYALAYPAHAVQIRELFPAMRLLTDLSQMASGAAADRASGSAAQLPQFGTLGDFRIVREVGRGGMGVVYEAEQISLQRRVALKVLPFATVLDPRHLQRFKNEAQAAASLRHPHIVQVHSVGSERGVHYYAMDFIDGRTMAALIADLRRIAGLSSDVDQPSTQLSSGEVPAPVIAENAADTARTAQSSSATDTSVRTREFLQRVADWGIQAAEALEHAHQMGVVHRDIKPSNLLIDLQGQLWITDFGLAVTRGGTPLTATGDVVGTLRYMSPEQASGHSRAVDHHTDIYSLAATLYELLTLHAPFPDGDRQAVWRQIISAEPVLPRRLNPAVPRDVETILIKALAKEPESRYATAGQFADDLRRFLRDEPIRARRPWWGERVVKWSRRHAALVTATAVVLGISAVLLAASVAYVWRAERRATAALDSAEAAREDTKAVLDFLTEELLAAADPSVSAGRKITVEEVLQNAEAGLERAFPERPSVEASIRRTMGIVYRSLGRFDDAERHFLRARSLYSSALGETDRLTLMMDVTVANTWRSQGRLADAITLHEEALAAFRMHYGDNDPDTLVAMSGLGLAYQSDARFSEAIELHLGALQIKRATLGDEDPETVISTAHLATAYAAVGRRDEAIAMQQDVMRFHRKNQGATHPETLSAMNNLATTYQAAGRLREAVPLLEETLQGLTEVLGPEHNKTLTTMNNLAGVYADVGRWDDAISLLDNALPIVRQHLGPDHRLTIVMMANLAKAYQLSGRANDAVALREETLRLCQHTFGAEHPDTLIHLKELATAYLDVGRPAEALPLCEESLRLATKVVGPEHPVTLVCMGTLANVYRALNQTEQARAQYEQSLSLMKKVLGAEHPYTLSILNSLADVYRESGQLQASLSLAQESLRLKTDTLGAAHPETLLSMVILGMVYRDCGRWNDALPLCEEAFSAMRRDLGPEHRYTIAATQVLANVYIDAGRWDDARSLLEELLTLQTAGWGRAHPQTLSVLNTLAATCRATDRLSEALPLLEEVRELQETQSRPSNALSLSVLQNLALTLMDLGHLERANLVLDEWLELVRANTPENPRELTSALAARGRCLLLQKEWSEAETVLRECLAIREQLTPEDWLQFHAQSMLGGSLNGQGQHEAAEPLVLEGYEGLAARAEDIPALSKIYIREAGERVREVYESWGRPDQAAAWRQKLESDK